MLFRSKAQRDRRRRQHLAERSFADAANNHGFKRARWRRLWRVQIQDWMIAAIQNVRILLRPRTRPAQTGAMAQVIALTESWRECFKSCVLLVCLGRPYEPSAAGE